MDRAVEHLGEPRAARYLRKFYPWYLERSRRARSTTTSFQESDDLDEARSLVAGWALGRPRLGARRRARRYRYKVARARWRQRI